MTVCTFVLVLIGFGSHATIDVNKAMLLLEPVYALITLSKRLLVYAYLILLENHYSVLGTQDLQEAN